MTVVTAEMSASEPEQPAGWLSPPPPPAHVQPSCVPGQFAPGSVVAPPLPPSSANSGAPTGRSVLWADWPTQLYPQAPPAALWPITVKPWKQKQAEYWFPDPDEGIRWFYLSLQVSDDLLALDRLPAGMLHVNLHLVQVWLHLLLQTDRLTATTNLCLQTGLHGLQGMLVAPPGGQDWSYYLQTPWMVIFYWFETFTAAF